MGTIQEHYVLSWTDPRSNTPQNISCLATHFLSHKPYKWDEQYMLGTTGEVRKNSEATFSNVLLHMDEPLLVDQESLISALFGYWIQPRGPHRNDGWKEQIAKESQWSSCCQCDLMLMKNWYLKRRWDLLDYGDISSLNGKSLTLVD